MSPRDSRRPETAAGRLTGFLESAPSGASVELHDDWTIRSRRSRSAAILRPSGRLRTGAGPTRCPLERGSRSSVRDRSRGLGPRPVRPRPGSPPSERPRWQPAPSWRGAHSTRTGFPSRSYLESPDSRCPWPVPGTRATGQRRTYYRRPRPFARWRREVSGSGRSESASRGPCSRDGCPRPRS